MGRVVFFPGGGSGGKGFGCMSVLIVAVVIGILLFVSGGATVWFAK